MPKIIENVKEQLLAEAARQIKEFGYSKTTVRSVASACSLGVGTVYNYFPSKDVLIASFMLEDWQRALVKMRSVDSRDPEEVLLAVYDSLGGFITSHRTLFSDPEAAKSFGAAHTDYHRILRRQIADIVLPVLSKTAKNGEFAAEFIAESLLTWTMEGKAFGDIYSILESIIII